MVKTKITLECAENILKNYNLGKLISLEEISQGSVQTNYKLICDKSCAILRIYENREYNSISYEVDILKKINTNGFNCPLPFSQISGDIIGSVMNKNYVLFEFIEGEHIENPSMYHKTQLIETVAKFNIAAKDVRSEYEKYRMNYNPKFCEEYARKAARDIGTKNAEDKLSWYLLQLSNLQLPDEMTKAICHGDFHFTNILYKNNEIMGLIDFDDANYTYACFDLVSMMDPFGKNGFDWHNYENFSKSDEVFDFEKSREVLRKYLKINPLPKLDLMHLYDVLCLAVLIDCLWFFERGSAQDFFEKRKLEYLQNLGRDKFYQNIV